MKRTYSILASLLIISTSLFAETVDYQSAEKIAKSHFASSSVSQVQLVRKTPGMSYTSGPQELYAFNNDGGGWIIVSGDDIAAPVLAYSNTGSLDLEKLPKDMLSWMNGVRSNIRAARSDKSTPKYVSKGSFGNGKLLTTPSWNQEAPYNNLCPLIGSNRSVTGCVATAMAIVLRYNKYPAKGKGTLESYSFKNEKGKNQTVNGFSIDDHTYDWDSMPYTYTSTSSSASRQAVAQLMYDLGVMMRMSYGYDTGSGAFSDEMIPELAEHMGYSKNARYLSHASYTHDRWVAIIANEIENNRPVLYDGTSEDGGHQFVCDGYDNMGRLHINWGWGGSGNGWFSASYLGNINTGIYTYDNIVVGLVPAGASEQELAPTFQFYDKDGGLSVSGDIVKGRPFQVSITNLLNFSTESCSGDFKVCLVDNDNNIKELISNTIHINEFPSMLMFSSDTPLTCQVVTSDILPTDGIMLAYEWNGTWTPVGVSNLSDDFSMPRVGVLDIPMIVTRKGINSGEYLYFNIHPGYENIKSVTWYYDGVKQSKGFVTATSGKHTIKAEVTYYTSSHSDTVTSQIEVP